MNNKNMKSNETLKTRRTMSSMGIGASLGLVFGTALGNIALGLTIGIVVGGIGAALARRRGLKK